MWGIEGINILFILTGLLLSVSLSLMLFRQAVHSPAFSFGVGSLPLVLAHETTLSQILSHPIHDDEGA